MEVRWLLLVGPDEGSTVAALGGCGFFAISGGCGFFAVGLDWGVFAVGLGGGLFAIGAGVGGVVATATCGKDERRSCRHGEELVAPSLCVHVCVLLKWIQKGRRLVEKGTA